MGVTLQTNLEETAEYQLSVHPGDGLITPTTGTDNPSVTMTLPAPILGARGPAIVLVTAEIDTSMYLDPSTSDEYVIDTRSLLTGASIITQSYTGRGTYYRRITMAFAGTLNLLLPNIEILKFSYKLKAVNSYLKDGDYFSVALSVAVFGQNIASTVALFKSPVLASLATGEPLSRAKRIRITENKPEETDFYPLTSQEVM
jgi:hypothetical protein